MIAAQAKQHAEVLASQLEATEDHKTALAKDRRYRILTDIAFHHSYSEINNPIPNPQFSRAEATMLCSVLRKWEKKFVDDLLAANKTTEAELFILDYNQKRNQVCQIMIDSFIDNVAN